MHHCQHSVKHGGQTSKHNSVASISCVAVHRTAHLWLQILFSCRHFEQADVIDLSEMAQGKSFKDVFRSQMNGLDFESDYASPSHRNTRHSLLNQPQQTSKLLILDESQVISLPPQSFLHLVSYTLPLIHHLRTYTELVIYAVGMILFQEWLPIWGVHCLTKEHSPQNGDEYN